MPFKRRPAFAEFTAAALAADADWMRLIELAPELEALQDCAQDPEHHAEGDVAVHTRMVLGALTQSPVWADADDQIRSILFWTAALHDVAKPQTTRRDLDGRLRAPGHAAAGARLVRRLFWEAGAPVLWREAVCSLIAAHMRPFHLIEQSDPRRSAIEIAESLRGAANARLLAAQAAADAAGRVCADQNEVAERVALAEALFAEQGLLEGRWPFANGASRAAFFARRGRNPFYAEAAPANAFVTLLSGLPGAGKDRWIAQYGGGRPVVSLDDIRSRIGAKPTGDQGRVIQEAYAAARAHLRKGEDFIWNATNLTRTLRAKPLALFRDYGAQAEIVYLETPPARLRRQNADREDAVPEAALDRMANKLEPPDGREASAVRWIVDGEAIEVAA